MCTVLATCSLIPSDDRVRAPCAALRADHLVHVSAIHLRAVTLYQHELGNALAVANREGEDARREERLRIWGYA